MILVASRSAISLTPDPHETGNSQVSPERRLNRNPQPTHRMRSFARFPPYGGANRTSRENRTRGCPPSASHGEWTSKLTRLLRQNNGCPSLPWVSKSSKSASPGKWVSKISSRISLRDFPRTRDVQDLRTMGVQVHHFLKRGRRIAGTRPCGMMQPRRVPASGVVPGAHRTADFGSRQCIDSGCSGCPRASRPDFLYAAPC
jgi:hypothetical protein